MVANEMFLKVITHSFRWFRNVYILVFISVVLQAVAALCAKFAAIKSVENKVFSTFLTAPYFLFLLLMVIQAPFWLLALRKLPLSRVFPFLALVPVLTILLGILFLGETVSTKNIIGMTIIVVGVFLMGKVEPIEQKSSLNS